MVRLSSCRGRGDLQMVRPQLEDLNMREASRAILTHRSESLPCIGPVDRRGSRET